MTDYGLRSIADAIKLVARAVIIAAAIRAGYSGADAALKKLTQ